MSRPTPAETKIVLCVRFRFSLWSVPEFLPEEIRERWPEMRVVFLEGYDRLTEELTDADIYVGFTLMPDQLASAKKLKWMHVTAAGVTHLIRDDIREREMEITNSRGIHAIPMGEHTIGMMIAMCHKFPASFRYQQKHIWAQQRLWDEPRGRVNCTALRCSSSDWEGRAAKSRASLARSACASTPLRVPAQATPSSPNKSIRQESSTPLCPKPISSYSLRPILQTRAR